ncbi:lysophospholipid acyltransferase family protein [Candidatus Clavichlamydia salmonicola]|uniref:lysophospholipid acyltransferase family protein n=1 Tax=Candidatus Clavichlamydia salmonicola TaxID=469812 RepID=UPI001891E0BE|nr:lysophospholipid acyltransferase family protein [Candidatus Clavichlamydia salmonicola]
MYGSEHFYKGSGVVAANHVSYLDPLIVGAAAPSRIFFLAKRALFKNWLASFILKQWGVEPIDKGQHSAHHAIFAKMMSLIDQGKKIAIFPEGTRSVNGLLQKGATGIGMIIAKTECLVIPTYVAGSFAIWSAKKKFPSLKGRTACVFGSPINCSTLNPLLSKKENYENIVSTIMDRIASLKDWYDNDRSGTPP